MKNFYHLVQEVTWMMMASSNVSLPMVRPLRVVTTRSILMVPSVFHAATWSAKVVLKHLQVVPVPSYVTGHSVLKRGIKSLSLFFCKKMIFYNRDILYPSFFYRIFDLYIYIICVNKIKKEEVPLVMFKHN